LLAKWIHNNLGGCRLVFVCAMKILFYYPLPFRLAHGGAQIQIEKTKAALERAGVEVEYLRWWDGRQSGDLIHVFGLVSDEYLHQARLAQMPVVLTQLFTETCNRSAARLWRQGFFVKTALALPFGNGLKRQLAWNLYRQCDQNIVGLEAERRVLQTVYGVGPAKISVVPLGLSEIYLGAAGAGARKEPHLICTGTITQRKNSVALAELARTADVPILFVGKPYSPDDPYWLRFKNLIDDRRVKHHPFVGSEAEMVSLLQSALGFVLMSQFENWCLSAHEAAACGLPLLVQNQNWSQERFGNRVRYFETIGFSQRNVEILRDFWEAAPALPAPGIKLHSWDEVAQSLKIIYEQVAARR
jgi:glycosyltransferase involved in cell wall biosynthesis